MPERTGADKVAREVAASGLVRDLSCVRVHVIVQICVRRMHPFTAPACAYHHRQGAAITDTLFNPLDIIKVAKMSPNCGHAAPRARPGRCYWRFRAATDIKQ